MQLRCLHWLCKTLAQSKGYWWHVVHLINTPGLHPTLNLYPHQIIIYHLFWTFLFEKLRSQISGFIIQCNTPCAENKHIIWKGVCMECLIHKPRDTITKCGCKKAEEDEIRWWRMEISSKDSVTACQVIKTHSLPWLSRTGDWSESYWWQVSCSTDQLPSLHDVMLGMIHLQHASVTGWHMLDPSAKWWDI